MHNPATSGGGDPGYQKYLRAEAKRAEDERIRNDNLHPRKFDVYHGGAPADGKKGVKGSHGWNIGDIDFDKDGSIFIRNPYLADAIETCLQENYKKWKAWSERNVKDKAEKDKEEPVLFRLTRDEGWSGPKVNMVC